MNVGLAGEKNNSIAAYLCPLASLTDQSTVYPHAHTSDSSG